MKKKEDDGPKHALKADWDRQTVTFEDVVMGIPEGHRVKSHNGNTEYQIYTLVSLMKEKHLCAINLQPEMKSWSPQNGTISPLFGICV